MDVVVEEEEVEYYDRDIDETNKEQMELNDRTKARLERNDSSLLDIQICLDDLFNSMNYRGEDGGVFNLIANNNHLKKLSLTFRGRCLDRPTNQPYILGEQGHNLPTRQQLLRLFTCINRNNSIRNITLGSMSIADEFGRGLIECLQGHPSLVSLHCSKGQLEPLACTTLGIGAVLRYPDSKLKDLRLVSCNLDDGRLGTLCHVLLGNSTMESLHLSDNRHITSVGWRTLANVIRHTNCKLSTLALNVNCIDDEAAIALGDALSGSSLMKCLNLDWIESISSERWVVFLEQLAQTPLKTLILGTNEEMDNNCVAALANIDTIENLELNGAESVTSSGWGLFFDSIQDHRTQLVSLTICDNSISDDDESFQALGRMLTSMNTLKKLNMNGSSNISPRGWQELFLILLHSNLDLVQFDMHDNQIDDIGINLLVPLVSKMSSLKYLSLSLNGLVTPYRGWQYLTFCVDHPDFALEELDLSNNNIDDDTLIACANALQNNETLKLLSIEGFTNEDSSDDEDDNELITERGWDAISNLICNKTSIMDTFNSNHTLQDLSYSHYYCQREQPTSSIPDDLSSLLELNENKDKIEVARQKILQTHFSTNDTSNLQVFTDLEPEEIPAAIAWIGRPAEPANWLGEHDSGLTLMYNLMRRIPDMFGAT